MDLALEAPPAGNQLARSQLFGLGRRASNEICQAVASVQELAILGRAQDSTRKASRLQRGPEAVARARKMVAHGRRV